MLVPPFLVAAPVQPRMIIKGMLGRYERWNPVHPTVAAVRKESRQRLLNFQENPQISGGVNLPKLGKGVSSSIQSTMEWQQKKTASKGSPADQHDGDQEGASGQ
ncbi:hypothetical protein E2562_007408 [Oryza meyeriana var. granulata]|uniref:Uncharacterized protein n=1 Tax=Oryza meyeriana var. granulata TaxID=110450 RepID=A0A6G1D0C7_9ORYZ|nr:hypothetical protein E2562_007408 [Oryza meyeriana var. granulata]